jgi:ubiquinone/menaquinone biosynthesis C-methylase UbiE
MSEYKFTQVDFDHPSALFVLEDRLKAFLGGPLLYNPYYRTFRLRGDENVLDFGCGGGAGSRCLANLLKSGGRLFCIDISGYWITVAEKRLAKYANVECRAGDIRTMEIADASFDVISALHVIHDIDPQERQETVNALARVLRPGGYFFLREPVKESHGIAPEELGSLLNNAGLHGREYKVTKSEYIGECRKAG